MSESLLKPREIVVFHSALGLRPGLLQWADRLRAAGHYVHAPDLYDGAVFDDAGGAIAKIQELGFDEILLRSQAGVANLPQDLVYVGFSNGGACAELLAATRPGARAALLIGALLPIREFGRPESRCRFTSARKTRAAKQQVVAALAARVRKAGAIFDEHVYPTAMHHFADPHGPGFDAAVAALMFERVMAFVSGV